MTTKNKIVFTASLGIILLAIAFIVPTVIQAGQKIPVSTIPLPQGTPAGTEYMIPGDLPAKTDGPYKNFDDIKTVALMATNSAGDSKAQISAMVRATHAGLITAGIFGQSYSVSDDREVYLATADGSFTFDRTPKGQGAITVSHINVEIDATTGEILAIGTSSLTKDLKFVKSLAAAPDLVWTY